MNELQIFENPEFGKIRAIEQNGEPWFVAADVCRALELEDVNKAVSRLDNDEGARIEIPHPQNPKAFRRYGHVQKPGEARVGPLPAFLSLFASVVHA